MLHQVEFIKQGGIYWPGDQPGLPLPEARFYVSRGRARWVDPPPNGGDAGEHSTHDMTVGEVRGFVASVDSAEALRALRDSEVAHPAYEGGRKTALKAIDERLEELGA